MENNASKKNQYPQNHEFQTNLSVYPREQPDTGERNLVLRRHCSIQTVVTLGLEENQPEFEEMLNSTDKRAVEFRALKMYRCSKESGDVLWKIIPL